MTNFGFDLVSLMCARALRGVPVLLRVLVGVSLMVGVSLVMAHPASAAPTTAPSSALPSTGPVSGGAVIAPELDDVEAEGVGVVILTVDDTPADLWEALSLTYPEWYSEYGAYDSGEGAFYVPVGTVVFVPGGTYLAMPDEMLGCRDWTTTGAECNGTNPADIAAYFDGTGPLTLWPAV
jgi:hypothetical protein